MTLCNRKLFSFVQPNKYRLLLWNDEKKKKKQPNNIHKVLVRERNITMHGVIIFNFSTRMMYIVPNGFFSSVFLSWVGFKQRYTTQPIQPQIHGSKWVLSLVSIACLFARAHTYSQNRTEIELRPACYTIGRHEECYWILRAFIELWAATSSSNRANRENMYAFVT